MNNNQMKLVNEFPRILEDVPDLVQRLETFCKWGKDENPSSVFRFWKEIDTEEKYYFLGWFSKAIELFGVYGQMYYFSLSQKRAVVKFIEDVMKEATEDEMKNFAKGNKESKHRQDD